MGKSLVLTEKPSVGREIAHKKMELRGEGENKTFTCTCGYREKLTIFNKRREAVKGQINKREVDRYLKQQSKKDGSINTALAEALAKLKL